MRRQVRHAHPRQDQKPRLVRDVPQMARALRRGPTEERVARRQMPRRARPQETADRSLARDDQILEVLTDGLAGPEVVMVSDERIDERLVIGAPRLPQCHPPELAQTAP